jgi:iron(III) transport system substrate-binding protein
MKLRTIVAALVALAPALGQAQDVAPPDQAAAEAEGKVVIYSNMAADNWRPIIDAFTAKYPAIGIETLDLGPSEVFTRYRAEAGTGVPSADLMVAGTIVDFIQAADDKIVMPYESAERANLPDWSVPFPGVYTLSADPMVLAYNKLLVPEDLQADTFAGFVKAATEHPDIFQGKIGTYEGNYAFGEGINYAFIRKHGDAGWAMLDAIGPLSVAGGGSGGMVEKMSTGEFVASFFVSAPVLLPKVQNELGDLLSWSFIKDGTPLFPRGMAITEKAPHPNAAKLFVDFVLSDAGQIAVAAGGLTPVRDDVSADAAAAYTIPEIREAVGGDENLLFIAYDRQMVADHEAFTERWKKAFGIP